MNGFLTKILLNAFVVIPLLLWFTDASWLVSIVTSLAISAITYLLGDQIILRMTSNTLAALADAAFVILFLWGGSYISNWHLTMTELLIIAVLFGSVEWMLHRQLRKMDETRIT